MGKILLLPNKGEYEDTFSSHTLGGFSRVGDVGFESMTNEDARNAV
jgi:hypothetical protein